MLILFLILVVLGLGSFAFVLMKELKGAPSGEGVQPVAVVSDTSDEYIELKAMCEAATQKSIQLEKMLEEKNAVINQLKKTSLSGDEHQAQVDSLKDIMQHQIEALKEQNKVTKEELSHVLEENVALQAKAFAQETGRSQEQTMNVSFVEPPSLLQDVFNPEDKNTNY